MNPIVFLKVKWLLRQARLVEACALNESNNYFNLTSVYYRLGMYETAFAEQIKKLDFHTLFAKTVSASYLGKQEDVLALLAIVQKEYPSYVKELIPYLAIYFPECAYQLMQQYPDLKNPVYLSLNMKIEGKEQTKKKFAQLLEMYSVLQNGDEKLLYTNVCIDNHNKKLLILNDYLKSFNLREIQFQDISIGLHVNNLESWVNKTNPSSSGLVSILVPAYNVEHLLKSCIESLINQDYANIEILIIDDASTDNTAHVIKQLEQQHSQVKGLFLAENVGPFAAKNYAAHFAKGEFLTTHDADDWAHPERILRQVQPLIKNRNLIATMCQWIRLSEEGDFYAKQHYPFKRLNPSSPMFRKDEVIQYIGLWDSVRMAADTEFIERLFLVYGRKRIQYLKMPLVIGAHRQNSLMTSKKTGNLIDRISPERLAYWEAWRYWHIQQTRLGVVPYMPWGAQYQPQFNIPESMRNKQLSLSNIYGNFDLESN